MILIRNINSTDYEAVSQIAILTNIFTPEEMETVKQLLENCFHKETKDAHRCFVAEDESKIVGVAYFTIEPLANRVWELVMLAVHPDYQSKQVGTSLINKVEKDLSATDQNMVILKTSSLPQYEKACSFYVKHGYKKEAQIENYWDAGDDLVLFSKKLTGK